MYTIIVAEDEPALAELMQKQLEIDGYSVAIASNGQQVWNLLEQGMTTEPAHKPDLIISDLMMPEMTGYELLEKVRADERFKAIPCLVLSNSGQVDDLNRAYTLGANEVLIKANFNPDQLKGKVEALLHQNSELPKAA